MLWTPFVLLFAFNLAAVIATLRMRRAPIEGALRVRITMMGLMALSIAALELPLSDPLRASAFVVVQLGLTAYTARTFMRWAWGGGSQPQAA